MLAVERTQYILDELHKKKVVMVGDLSREMRVSEETIRRDLEKLEKQGSIRRVHGGAYLPEGYGNETPITVREKIYREEKVAIARKCMQYIYENESILLDCSTTAHYIARELGMSAKRLSVITNSLSVAAELAGKENIRVIMLGGELKNNTNSFWGDVTLRSLDEYYADKAFISSAGISILAGISDYTQEEAAVRRRMIERAGSCYIAADMTKVGRSAVNMVLPLSSADFVITDQPIEEKDKQLKKELDRLKVEMIVCD